MKEEINPQITVEVPSQPFYPQNSRRPDRILEYKYKLLDALIPADHWQDFTLDLITYVAGSAVISSVLAGFRAAGISIALPLSVTAVFILIALAVLAWWLINTVPESLGLVVYRAVLVLGGLLIGAWL